MGTWTPTSSHGGGTAAPITREQITGGATTIADGASASLPWSHDAGSALLDYTVAAAPTIITAGVYALVVMGHPTTALTAGGSYYNALDFDADGEDVQVTATVPGVSGLAPRQFLALTWYAPAGAKLTLSALNKDGAASRDFNITAFLQRLS